ncbi:MAG: long-chain-fatty-acid--CoA ligase [Gammaproteobacteria bacterium]|nr:long-chain-fatty-acid--CoA ligase [Gammaproteobacteria bacterium]MCP4089777.1 long-chain-fatty-acid--CoA ligase [Gammaproteobacteria bacterium]MCP4278206.1 long-chain-fatty-acid--CoA ligase [Gammaproteobacteria bacterium]MCP4831925.1 long-chain-fatty-acid--CoA ligase [Gammaproteobacteria bacterium]MCP4927603.1 long-chain-fatty-acid--CoA ligase [Gammaproteobacteria bacterium]
MQGLMMNSPLLITTIMRFALLNHAGREIVSVTEDNPRHRYTYAEAFARAAQLANAFRSLGIQQGDRIATLAWNDHRHFELYYGISCSGSVCHTINPRLFPEQIHYIIEHAEDRLVFVDPVFVSVLEQLQGKLNSVESFVVLTDAEHMPETTLRNAVCYEDFIGSQAVDFDWPNLDETTASSLCYTSGTMGDPKGVLFSHRATVLHAYGISLPDVMNLGQRDCVMPVVPMFHVNAWGVPYAVPMIGAKLVLPGSQAGNGAVLYELMESEGVSFSLAVPTVWLALLEYLKQAGLQAESLKRICVGGAACPASIVERFRDDHNVYVHHAWGMTEMSPVGAYNTLKAGAKELPDHELLALQLRQGRGLFGVEMKITDDAANALPWDGKTNGALKVRGNWICSAYYKSDEAILDADGWFDTGDVATIDSEGFMQITDRSKDLVKSGGEWISSIELENTAVNHPGVAEAAVIAVAHEKWIERPLLIVVPHEDGGIEHDEMLNWFAGKVVNWWIPDDVVFVSELPHTATGKIKKSKLRMQFSDYQLPISNKH